MIVRRLQALQTRSVAMETALREQLQQLNDDATATRGRLEVTAAELNCERAARGAPAQRCAT
jgi:hypothetical protein